LRKPACFSRIYRVPVGASNKVSAVSHTWIRIFQRLLTARLVNDWHAWDTSLRF
jgi:hypothetical protein